MTGLGDLFDEAEGRAAREAASARLEGDELGAVHSRVRKAHARRSALQASLVAVAVVVVGAGVAYGLGQRGATEVADSPVPSPSASATPSETPSPSPTLGAWPGFAGTVTEDSHLPTARAITPEVWDSAGPGWSLVSYQESWVDGADIVGPQVIYLVSPAGERYELLNLDGDTVSVLAWEAGSASAAVSVQPAGDAPYSAVVDLVTGELTPTDGYAPYIWSIAFLDSSGNPVFRGSDATAAYLRIAPDGTQDDYTIPAADGAAEVALDQLGLPGVDCEAAAPYDDESSLVHCIDSAWANGSEVDLADAHFTVARVWPADARADLLYGVTGDRGKVGVPTRAGEYVVAVTGGHPDDCSTQYSVLEGGTAAAIPGVDSGLHPLGDILLPFGSVDQDFTWGITSGCNDGMGTPMVVVNSDLSGEDFSVLVPYPEGRPAGETPLSSVTGVAVAH